VKFLLSRLRGRLPIGYWSGLGFGLVTFVLAALVLTVSYWAVRPFVWAALYGVAYVAPPGPYSPLSGEWLFVQIIWLMSGVALGFTVRALSGGKIHLVFLTLTVLWTLVMLPGEPGTAAEGWRLVLQYVQVPLGVVLGALLQGRARPRSSSQIH
jgi:hypothetical protein